MLFALMDLISLWIRATGEIIPIQLTYMNATTKRLARALICRLAKMDIEEIYVTLAER